MNSTLFWIAVQSLVIALAYRFGGFKALVVATALLFSISYKTGFVDGIHYVSESDTDRFQLVESVALTISGLCATMEAYHRTYLWALLNAATWAFFAYFSSWEVSRKLFMEMLCFFITGYCVVYSVYWWLEKKKIIPPNRK
ncbi:hypothetical protein DM02DRAFT_279047 [Periconia macrospinosa]|uniref:Uncharacterized protein n=1 Tax=Periconia macrospinosa TaxID=97972 RepID=A0A2V1D2X8_9PLEO|nr:hypothetical protein DM02DRAFT_279047 [Periconia macrospinosa]